MAVTGLDFHLPTIQHNHDPASSIMDKQSFDLNKHAFDLNEVPLNDLREASCSHEVGSPLHPRRGGWLEMFRNMFGNDKVMLDSAPFAMCTTMLNSSFINHMSQADKIQQLSDSRMLSSQTSQIGHNLHDGHGIGQNRDVGKDSVAGANNPSYMPHQLDKHSKPFTSEELNHINIITPVPLFNHAGAEGSHVAKPLFNASGQPVCATSDLPPFVSSSEGLKFKAGSVPWGCDGNVPPHLGGLYTSTEKDSVGGISHGLDHHKASVPVWDLNSQAFPQWAPDSQILRISKPSCITSSGHFSHTHISDKFENGSSSAQVSDTGSMEVNNNCKDLITCLEKVKGSTCPSKKGSSSSDRGKALELMNAENSSLSENKAKNQDLRIRIIPSPDWLPAGWITELKTRMAGSTAGTTDKYYKEPSTGRRFRSKNEVLSFLQTGRLCRNKPQLKPVEGFTSMPFLLPRQDQSVCLLENAILERVKVKQEQINMIQDSFLSASSDACRVSNITVQVGEPASYTVERAGLAAKEPGQPYVPGISYMCMNSEPVHSHKRKVAEDSVYFPSPKRFQNSVKDLLGKDKWIFCLDQISREAERQEIITGVESDTKVAHTRYPGLLHRQDPNGAQDKVASNYLMARYKANAKALGLFGTPMVRNGSEITLRCTKELQPKTTCVIKVGDKKSIKVILKQERDMLVTLGRKLCVEFLTSAKESSSR